MSVKVCIAGILPALSNQTAALQTRPPMLVSKAIVRRLLNPLLTRTLPAGSQRYKLRVCGAS